MSERYSDTPPGPDYFMEVAGDAERAESTVGRGWDRGAELLGPTTGGSSADAADTAPEFEI